MLGRYDRVLRHHYADYGLTAQAKSFHGSYEDPTLHIQVPLQVAAEREIARYYFRKVDSMLRQSRAPGKRNVNTSAQPDVQDPQAPHADRLDTCHLQAGRHFDAADWAVSLASFAHPAVDNFSVIGIVLAPFIFAANMFGFVLAVRSLLWQLSFVDFQRHHDRLAISGHDGITRLRKTDLATTRCCRSLSWRMSGRRS